MTIVALQPTTTSFCCIKLYINMCYIVYPLILFTICRIVTSQCIEMSPQKNEVKIENEIKTSSVYETFSSRVKETLYKIE